MTSKASTPPRHARSALDRVPAVVDYASLRAAGLAIVFLLLIPAFGSAQPPSPGIVVVATTIGCSSDQAFVALPTDTANLAVNLARLVTGGPGGRIHAYSDYFSFAGTQLATTLQNAGYSYSVGIGIPFDLPTLSNYDALFMGIPLPSSAQLEVLRQDVARGGSVYIHGGNGTLSPIWFPTPGTRSSTPSGSGSGVDSTV